MKRLEIGLINQAALCLSSHNPWPLANVTHSQPVMGRDSLMNATVEVGHQAVSAAANPALELCSF
ncbi:hypothetical protein OUZ56_032174 [Daphnia magna]|uniref:Uncharacterized protein n=1 Tax=Daphnia magna TaxID=35525 RepID=A0ABQ9ZWC9_9CRUS|nr:hypothetical protein OUZ56_032174 [Daphnia magna]